MKKPTLTKKFVTYSFLWTSLMFLLPLIYRYNPKVGSSYWDVFDKVSIPFGVAFFSAYWLFLDLSLKSSERTIKILKTQLEKFKLEDDEINHFEGRILEKELEILEYKNMLDLCNQIIFFSALITAMAKGFTLFINYITANLRI